MAVETLAGDEPGEELVAWAEEVEGVAEEGEGVGGFGEWVGIPTDRRLEEGVKEEEEDGERDRKDGCLRESEVEEGHFCDGLA